MAMITVRVSDAEKEWLSYMAEFYGITLSELLKTYSMEQLEDEYDRQTAEIAHKHWVESGKQQYPWKKSFMNLEAGMTYRLEFTPEIQKQLRKMDKHQATLIVRWLYQHIDGIDDPRKFGKGLTANRSGQWRYRIGKYRVLVEIEDDQMVVIAIQVGHRRNIYD